MLAAFKTQGETGNEIGTEMFFRDEKREVVGKQKNPTWAGKCHGKPGEWRLETRSVGNATETVVLSNGK